MIDLGRHLRPGDGVWWPQGASEPPTLVDALLEQVPAIGPVSAFVGLSTHPGLTTNPPVELSVRSYGGLGGLWKLDDLGRLGVIPCHYSALPTLFAAGTLPTDVALLHVTTPDKDGFCTLGLSADYAADALPLTSVLIAEMNPRLPVVPGAPRIHVDRFAAVVESDRPLWELPSRAPSTVDEKIATSVASLIEDGATLQIGVGSLPSAVFAALSGHKDLGLHTGLLTGDAVALVETGVLTGAFKEADPGVHVTGSIMGDADLYARVADSGVEVRPTSHTHSASVLSRFSRLVSVNSALEVDITGQIGAEYRHSTYYGAIGGQNDFCRAASAGTGLSIIALRSTAKGESTIKAALENGAVTTSKADVDAVVTEHGIAHLRGADLAERARRLIAVAAPEHRETLERDAHASGRYHAVA